MIHLKLLKNGFFLAFAFLLLLGLQVSTSLGQQKSASFFHYQNPNTNLKFRDTHIIPDDGIFYAIGTSRPYWGGESPGVKLYKSKDLKNWKFVDLLIDAKKLDDNVWYKDRFWAPELHEFNGTWYLTFNCQNNDGGNYASENKKHYHACGMAVSDKPEGPYRVVTHDEPLTPFPSNDLTLFQDGDGTIYALFNNGWTDLHHIYVAELDTNSYKLKEAPVKLISQEPGKWDGGGIEGAHVFKEKGTYYMFYSSWTRGYAVGYATADNIYGPWTKNERNPLFGAFVQNDTTYLFREGEALAEPASPYVSVGHNQVFKGPNGKRWISFHGYREGDDHASMIMDPIWLEDGQIKTQAPTYTPQKVEIKQKILERFPGLSN